MLHTPHFIAPTAEIGAARVRCRARTWRVIQRRDDPRGAQWWLQQGDAAPRLIAAPPDDVSPLPDLVRRTSRRAALRALQAAVRDATPVWWPRHVGRLTIQPRPWQMVPAMAMLAGRHRRLLLADEIGLGKTIAAGVLLHELHARDADAATLVVTPAGLVPQWLDELQRRLDIDARLLDADAFRREATHPSVVVDAGRAGGCWVVSLDLLRQPDVPGLLTRTRWTQLVVDEAHLAAPGSARHDAVARVAAVSERVLLLTGTPTAGGVPGAESLRRLGGRDGERPMIVLRRTSRGLLRPPCRRRVLTTGLDAGHAALVAQLDRFAARARRERGTEGLLPALVLLRRALSCPAAAARSLNRRLEVLGTAPLTAQPSLFMHEDDAAEDDEEPLLRVAAWHDEDAERRELRQLAALAERLPPGGHKLRAVCRLLRRAGEPAIVFTMYRDTLRELRRELADVDAVVVHGQQPEALRHAAIHAFTSGSAGVLLTTDASAEGLNLQARCRLVVHTEVPPSSRILLQRVGRVDRFGQARRVHSIVLASSAQADREALRRLAGAHEISEAWLAADAALECRRSRLAARMAAASSDSPRPDACRPCAASISPRRWRRFAQRAGLTARATAVRWGRLQFDGVPLAAYALPVLVATPSDVPPPSTWTIGSWRQLLPHVVRRAERLAARVASWRAAADDAVAARVAEDGSAPHLFDDARQASRRPQPSCSSGATVTFMLDGRLERRP